MVKVKYSSPYKWPWSPREGVRYSSILSLISALDRGGRLTPRPGLFAPRKETLYRLCRKAEWASGPVWTGAENFAPTRVRTACPLTSRYADYAIPLQLHRPQSYNRKSNINSGIQLSRIFCRSDFWMFHSSRLPSNSHRSGRRNAHAIPQSDHHHHHQ